MIDLAVGRAEIGFLQKSFCPIPSSGPHSAWRKMAQFGLAEKRKMADCGPFLRNIKKCKKMLHILNFYVKLY